MANMGNRVFLVLAVSLVSATATAQPFGRGLDTSNIARKWLDVPYADQSPAQKLDIYLPEEGEGPFPVIVAIHGGAFKFGDKRGPEMGAMLTGLERGYAVVSVNYRLSGEAVWPALIHDVKAAIRWIKANAAKHRLDPNRLAVWGGSAGGHLAALVGTSAEVDELEDKSMGNPEQSSRVQAVVDWFGPIDFLTMDEQYRKSGINGMKHSTPNSPESELFGKPITEATELVKAASPQTYITADDPPFLIQHGTVDPLIPVQQSAEFAAALQKVLGAEKVIYEPLEGASHGGPQFSSPANVKRVLDFLDAHLKKSE